jgi:hypothetical protein
MMSPLAFLTLTLRSPRNGTMKKTATGSHLLSVTPGAMKLLAVVPGRRESMFPTCSVFLC